MRIGACAVLQRLTMSVFLLQGLAACQGQEKVGQGGIPEREALAQACPALSAAHMASTQEVQEKLLEVATTYRMCRLALGLQE